MNRRRQPTTPVRVALTAAAVVALVALAAAFQPWRLLVDTTVNEAEPTVEVSPTVQPTDTATAVMAPSPNPAPPRLRPRRRLVRPRPSVAAS